MLRAHTGLNVLIPGKVDERPCRVCYLLHGLHGNQDTWLDNTMLPVFSKDHNTVFVMPEAGRSFYRDMRYGARYFSYISEELPDICRRTFNISADRRDTAVIGCSMGGYGSLLAALSRPDRFGFCGAMSTPFLFAGELLGFIRSRSVEWIRQQDPEKVALWEDLKCIFGEGLESGPGDDPSEMIKRTAENPEKPVIYCACGEGDEFYEENLRFSGEAKNRGFDLTWEGWPGVHDWVFFNEALIRALGNWKSEK
jgi:S-formylglutathione hydrolase FrmB